MSARIAKYLLMTGAAALSAGAVAPVANAAEAGGADPDATPTMIVPYGDLNLGSAPQRRTADGGVVRWQRYEIGT